MQVTQSVMVSGSVVSASSMPQIILHHLLLSELLELMTILKLIWSELDLSVISKDPIFILLDEVVFLWSFFSLLDVLVVIIHLDVLLDLSIDLIGWLLVKLNVLGSGWRWSVLLLRSLGLFLDGSSRAVLNKFVRLVGLVPVLVQLGVYLIEELLLVFVVLIGLLQRLDRLHDV